METKPYKHAFVLGVFIVVAIGILVVTVLTLGGEKKSFTKKFQLKVLFHEINGLKEGNNVWFYGVKIGTVKSIVLKGASNVEVTLNIEKKAQPYIKRDAVAKIGSEGFLGNKIVIIYGGSSAPATVENDGYLRVQKDSITNEDMIATLQAGNRNLLEITNNLKIISEKIKSGQGTIGKLIDDPAVANSIHLIADNLKVVSSQGKKSIANIEDFTERINDENSSVNKLFADTVLYDSIKNAIILLQSLVKRTNEFAGNMNVFAENLKTTSESLKDTSNTVGVLLNDKQTADSLKVIVNNLTSASKRLDEDLKAAQHNFLLRGYFKKENKNISEPH